MVHMLLNSRAARQTTRFWLYSNLQPLAFLTSIPPLAACTLTAPTPASPCWLYHQGLEGVAPAVRL